ncbi:MAG TPA: tetratricopeptide repeat protein, partial [bacterium]|nr:tetratricopeptide repeat protein [bacterium]
MIPLAAALLSAFFATAEVVSTEATRLTQHGDAQLAAGDAAAAVESYREAIAKDPRLFEARVNLGAALVEMEDIEGAIEALEAARKVKPDNPQLLRNLGRAYMSRERWSDATDVLAKARALEPGNDNGTRL